MDFISNRQAQNAEMLKMIGVASVEELFAAIPEPLRLLRPQQDDGLSEYEGMRLMEAISAKNRFQDFTSYLGAGAYEHHIPALVGAICTKSEFLTSYTPYQPEASQGMLQAIFEFQKAICALTGLDVSNASLYDGASACAEGMLMALRCQKKRHHVLIAGNIHPHYRKTVKQYLCHPEVSVEAILFSRDGQIDEDDFKKQLEKKPAAVLVQYPNFFGGIDSLKNLSSLAKEHETLFVVCANPIMYGLFASADELGADIAVGDCQPLGIPLQFGGPYAGYIACRKELLRQLPGRIVGETVDTDGKRGFVLTLQAREQHIRREKATSNICTNQALSALASLVAMLWYGKKGLRLLALTNFQRAAYLRNQLSDFCVVTPFSKVPVFNEFVIKFSQPMNMVLKTFRSQGIEPGLDLGRLFPEFKDHLLVAVTETKNKTQLDEYVSIARQL